MIPKFNHQPTDMKREQVNLRRAFALSAQDTVTVRGKRFAMRMIRGRRGYYRYDQPVQSRARAVMLAGLMVFTTIFSGYNVFFVDAGDGPIEHYSARRTSEQTKTTSGWSAVTGTADSGTTASTNGWVDSTNLTAGEDYLVMVWGQYDGSNAAMQVGLRVTHGGTAFGESESINEVDLTAAQWKGVYHWFTVWTAVASEDLEVEYYGSNTNTSRAEDVTMIVINAEDLVADGDLQYNIDTTGATGAAALDTNFTAKASLSWTPANADDTWWINGYVQGDTIDVDTDDLEFQLNVDGTVQSTSKIEGEDATDTPVRGIGWAQTLPASLQDIDLEIREDGADQAWGAAGIFALRLNRFEDFAIDTTDGDGANMTTVNTKVEQAALDPAVTTAGDWLVVGGGVADDNGRRIQCNIDLDNSAITDEAGGWQFRNADRMPVQVADVQLSLSTGAQNFDFDCQYTNNTGTQNVEDPYFVAFSMEEAGAFGSATFPILTQEDYIFENDDGINSDIGVSRTGSVSTIDNSSNSSSQSVTVPSDAELIIVSAAGWEASPSSTYLINGSVTIGGSATTLIHAGDGENGNHVGMWYRASPATGSQTLAWDWEGSGDPDDGVTITYAFYKGVDTTDPIGDSELEDQCFNCSSVSTSSLTVVDGDGLVAASAGIGTDTTWTNVTEQTDGSFNSNLASYAEAFPSGNTAVTSEVDGSGSDYYNAMVAAVINQTDDVSVNTTAQAGSQFTSPKTLDAIRAGERTNLRFHLKNTGDGAVTTSDELALFYDRSDGIWSRVESNAQLNNPAGSGCGASGSSAWTCTTVDNDTDSTGWLNSLAISPDGRPYVAYRDVTALSLVVAEYVGSGGSGCGASGSSAWTCTTVDDDTDNTGGHASIAFSPDGTPYVAYEDATATSLMIAEHVGSGGSGCGASGSSAWTCTTVDNDTDSTGLNNSLAFNSSGTPFVSYYDTTADSLMIAEHVGSGGSGCGASGSSAWTCTTVDDDTDNTGQYTSLAFSPSGTPYISYYDSTADSLMIAEHVGSGGSGCGASGSSAWTCTTVDDDTDNTGLNTSLAFSPDGTPYVAYRDATATSLMIAEHVGSGGSGCGASGSSAWTCTTVDNDTDSTGLTPSLAFGPDGTPYVAYRDATATSLMLARYVGSGGSGCGASGSSAWTCTVIDNDTDSTGLYAALAFGNDGIPYIAYQDSTATSLMVATVERGGEILIAPSQSYANNDNLDESHADMTSATDTTNGDDADCISGSTTWNNGEYFETATGTGLSLAVGNTTAQCTEIMWTLDTAQAIAGTTYRFVLATKDSPAAWKSTWRGPATVDEYPTITVVDSGLQDIRYSKDSLYTLADCTDTDWGCAALDNDTDITGEYNNLAFSPDGTPYVSYHDNTTDGLMVAQYVGSGGTGCGASGSSAWTCTTVHDHTSGVIGEYTSLAFSPDGTPHVSYYHAGDGNLVVAQYVGSGGSGCGASGSSAWTCTAVDDISAAVGLHTSLAFGPDGAPFVSYNDNSNTRVRIARYVGSNGSGCGAGGSSAWTCQTLDDTGDGIFTSAAFSPDGIPYVAYHDDTATSVRIAQFVGSGGSGCSGGNGDWTCTTVDDDTDSTGDYIDLAFSPSGAPHISYYDTTATALMMAEYVGSGGSGCGASGSSAWTCTTVDDDTDNTGQYTSIAFDSEGAPHIGYYDATASSAMIAEYVSSGGSGCGTSGSSAWTCSTIDNTGTATGTYISLAFDRSALPWMSLYDSTNTSLRIAKLHLPPEKLSESYGNTPSTSNAGSGDYRYLLTSGRSDYTESGVNCSGNDSIAGYCGLRNDNGDYDSLSGASANETPLYGMATRYASNSELPSIQWIGATNLAPNTSGSAGDIVIEVYRFGTTNAWEEVARDSTSSNCSSDNCLLNGLPSGTPSEYFETSGSDYWVYVRVYQETNGSTTITFQTDAFRAQQQVSALRSGGFFRDGELLPLNQRR